MEKEVPYQSKCLNPAVEMFSNYINWDIRLRKNHLPVQISSTVPNDNTQLQNVPSNNTPCKIHKTKCLFSKCDLFMF